MAENIRYLPGKFDFPLLSDPDHKVVDLYGIHNPADRGVRESLPYPVVYLINKEGVVAYRFFDEVNFTRPTNEQIREEMKKLGWVS
jgi:peroxiredoxin